jgi:hypothetical protein
MPVGAALSIISSLSLCQKIASLFPLEIFFLSWRHQGKRNPLSCDRKWQEQLKRKKNGSIFVFSSSKSTQVCEKEKGSVI